MKKKAIVFALAGVCLLFFITGPALAGDQIPSAKFAATWTRHLGLSSVAYIPWTSTDTVALDADLGYTLAKIKVPQDKELLVGVSAGVGLVTLTGVKGKNGGSAKSMAGAGGWVLVAAVPEGGGPWRIAKPGLVTLSARFQALEATLGGYDCIAGPEGGIAGTCADVGYCDIGETDLCVGGIRDGEACTTDDECPGACTDGKVGDPCLEDANCDIAAGEVWCQDEEMIALLLGTLAAHHFNFVLPEMDQGVYKIKAFFVTGALAKVEICNPWDPCYDGGTASAMAGAYAVINKTMLTVQQVRAAEGGLIDWDLLQ